ALLLDKHELSDASWGWGYRSTLPWSFQLEHWRLHQQVLLRGQIVVLRLMDIPAYINKRITALKKEEGRGRN
ncbi:hypothetical protein IQ211_17320, partial [Xenorhabdus griffiniae]|nr:hypothetical protein [Xenorhabdus griffiniae]